MGVFEDLLEKVSDLDRRKTLTEIAEQEQGWAKELEAGVLRQSDYSKRMDELKAKENGLGDLQKRFDELSKQHTDAAALNTKWSEWVQTEWDEEHGMTKAQVEAMKEIATRDARISELEGRIESGDDEMTLDDIDKRVDELAKNRGFLTAERAQELVDKKGLETALNNGFVSVERFVAESTDIAAQHRKEFGEDMSLSDYMKFCHENGKSIKDGYAGFTAERRADAEKQRNEESERKIQERIKEEVAKKEAEIRKEAAMGANGRMPVDVGGPPAQGALGQRLTSDKESADDIKSKPLGRGILSREAAIEYANKTAGTAT